MDIRAFIAIELDEKMHGILAEAQAKLKPAGVDVKWVNPENIHLTLKFLGNVEREKIDGIKNALDSIAAKNAAFEIGLSLIGAFPSLNKPRVIWAGVKEGAREAAKLANELENPLAALGFQKEKRPFSAHLTLGRLRSPRHCSKLKGAIEAVNNSSLVHRPSSIIITHLTLFQSTLTPKGPIYAALHKSSLAKI